MVSPAPDPKSVFLNVPYDAAYQPYFASLVSALVSLGQSAREIAAQRGGTLFRPAAFRTLVAVATDRARSQGLIPP